VYEPLGLVNLAVAAGIGIAAGIVGTLGIKAVFAFKKLLRKKQQAPHSPAATAPAPHAAEHQPTTSPPPPATREDWEKHGFGPAIVGAEMIGGFTGRWPPLSEMGRLGNIMTWATGIGYGLLYGVAITPWTQQPILGFVLLLALVMVADYGLLVPWGIFKPPWKEGHAFFFNLLLYGVYCALTVAAFWAALQVFR
jgi:hypothetical protein